MDQKGVVMDNENLPEAGEGDEAVEARRKVLKLGVYAAYTAPILLAMATSAKAQVTSSLPVVT
jgi:hypothetical protein